MLRGGHVQTGCWFGHGRLGSVRAGGSPTPSSALRFARLPVQLALLGELLVELAELPQEAVVGADLPLVPHGGHGQTGVHFVAQHEVRDDHGGRAAVAFPAVDVHLPCRDNVQVNEGIKRKKKNKILGFLSNF